MGARLYAPGIGRFLSVDPVYGGNSNSYEYCSGDGVNCEDTSGLAANCRSSYYTANSDRTKRWTTWAGVKMIHRTRVSKLQARCHLNSHDGWKFVLALDNTRNTAISVAMGILGATLCSVFSGAAALTCGIVGVFVGLWVGAKMPGSYVSWYSNSCRGRGMSISATITSVRTNTTRYIPIAWGWYVRKDSSWNGRWSTVPRFSCR